MKTLTTKLVSSVARLLQQNNSSNRKRIFIFLTAFFLLSCSVGKIYGQPTQPCPSACNPTPGNFVYCNACSLAEALAMATSPGDVVTPGQPNLIINLDGLPSASFPLTVHSGVTLEGDYNLFTNPEGTLMTSENFRGDYPGTQQQVFLFQMEHGATIRNLRIRGASLNWQDFNDAGDPAVPTPVIKGKICAGIYFIGGPAGTVLSDYEVSNCEIAGFSYAGLFSDANTSNINISNCYIHHVRGIDNDIGIGYGTWLRGTLLSTSVGITNITNTIFDDCKEPVDGDAGFMSWNINSCTATQFFFGGMGKHNGSPDIGFIHFPVAVTCPGNAVCIYNNNTGVNGGPDNVDDGFTIRSWAGGDFFIHNTIFHMPITDDGTVSNIVAPYPFRPLDPNIISIGWVTPPANAQVLCANGSGFGGSGTGADDNYWLNIPIPFTFNFLGNLYAQCNISTNGFIQFGNLADSYPAPRTLPKQGPSFLPHNLIAMCWYDLDLSQSFNGGANFGTLKCWSTSGANQKFIIEWENAPDKNNSSLTVSGQIHLLNDGKIEVHINSQNFLQSGNNKRVLGIESEEGKFGLTPQGYNLTNWQVTVPEAWQFPLPVIFDLDFSNNTFVAVRDACDTYYSGAEFNKGGYAVIADNYAESCPWFGDANITLVGNNFNYMPGMQMPGSPQPPEVTVDLRDALTGDPLPATFNSSVTPNHEHVLYASLGQDFNIALNHGTIISQTCTYIVRKNPSNQPPDITAAVNVTSGNNYFYYDEEVTAPTGLEVLIPDYHYVDNTNADLPGLYGIDVMAVDGSTNSTYHASAWQHIPLIVPPADDYIFIFNIKDSYQKFHNLRVNNGNATGVYKQVALNNTMIWQEDIADGGDGWERVELDFTEDIPNTTTPILSLINTNGEKNTLTFSIYIFNGSAVSTDNLKGLLVWVDDVYLKKYGSPDNLIADGDVERAACNGLGSDATDDCSWYQTNKVSYDGCTSLAIENDDDAQANLYSDGSPVTYSTPGCTGPATQASVTKRDRKSGNQAIVLKLPALDFSSCTTYNNACPSNPQIVISAATDFDFTDLLNCTDYDPLGQNLLGFSYLPCPLNASPAAGNYYLNQPCTLSNNITLASCIIAMGPNASLTVPSGITLTIINNGANISHLFACGNMWGGIINNGGTLDIHGDFTHHNKIEDAEVALYSNGGVVKVYYNDFKDNFTDISLEGSFPFPQNNIYGNNFSNTYTLLAKAPHNGIPSNARIQLNNVTDLVIGNIDDADLANNLTEAIYGIFATNSSFTVYNNNFADIRNFNSPCRSCSADIYGVSNDGNPYTITVGDVNTAQDVFQNSFSNSDRGILFRGRIHAVIEGNVFNAIDRQGIQILDNSYANIEIKSNQGFEDVNTGIWISSLTDCYIDVHGNTFDNSNYNPPASAFHNTAMTIQNARNTYTYIYDNTIVNNRLGIHTSGVDRLTIGMDVIGNIQRNRIEFNYPDNNAVDPAIFSEGIWVQSCPGAIIVGGGDAGNPDIENMNVAISGVQTFIGIDVEASTDCRINCNSIKNIPYSMNFTGNCADTKLKYNDMVGYEHGVHLQPNAFLPAQGDLDAGSGQFYPYDNEWDFAGTEPPNILKVSEVNSPILWYFRDLQINTNPFCPIPSSLNVIPSQTTLIPTPDCLDFSRYEGRENSIGKAVNDSLEFDENPDENMYQAKMGAYKTLKDDSALIYQGKPDDYVYENFVADMDAGNMGLLDSVNTLMNDSNMVNEAQVLNTSINDTNNVEYYLKTVNEIHLSYLTTGVLTAADTAVLDYIAHLPLSLAGAAIYMAAAHLGLEIHQQFNSITRKAEIVIDKNKSVTRSDVFMYPNPAFDKAYFYIKPLKAEKIVLIEIYDSGGNKIMMQPAYTSKDTYDLDVTGFAAGVYSFKINCSNKTYSGTFSKFK